MCTVEDSFKTRAEADARRAGLEMTYKSKSISFEVREE